MSVSKRGNRRFQPLHLRTTALLLLSSLACFSFQRPQDRPSVKYVSWDDAVKAVQARTSTRCSLVPLKRSLLFTGAGVGVDLENLSSQLRKKLAPVLPDLVKLRLSDCQRLNMYDVAVAYAEVVAAKDILKVAQGNLLLVTELLNIDKNRFEAADATVPGYDLLHVESEVGRCQFEVVTMERDLLLAEGKLLELLGQTPEGQPPRVIPLDALSIPDVEGIPPVGDLVNAAVQHRPDYLFKKIWYERVEVDVAQKDAQLQAGKRQIVSEVTSAVVALQSDRAAYETMVKRRKLSEQVVQPTLRGYERGAIPLTDALEVLRIVLDSGISQVQTEKDHFLDQQRLKCAVGSRIL